jgi:hypothetical protein
MSEQTKGLTKPQIEALQKLAEVDRKETGSWHRSVVLGHRSRNAWRLYELHLVDRRDVHDKTGKAFAYEYRINDSGKEALAAIERSKTST